MDLRNIAYRVAMGLKEFQAPRSPRSIEKSSILDGCLFVGETDRHILGEDGKVQDKFSGRFVNEGKTNYATGEYSLKLKDNMLSDVIVTTHGGNGMISIKKFRGEVLKDNSQIAEFKSTDSADMIKASLKKLGINIGTYEINKRPTDQRNTVTPESNAPDSPATSGAGTSLTLVQRNIATKIGKNMNYGNDKEKEKKFKKYLAAMIGSGYSPRTHPEPKKLADFLQKTFDDYSDESKKYVEELIKKKKELEQQGISGEKLKNDLSAHMISTKLARPLMMNGPNITGVCYVENGNYKCFSCSGMYQAVVEDKDFNESNLMYATDFTKYWE
jgi:hypothetical protein